MYIYVKVAGAMEEGKQEIVRAVQLYKAVSHVPLYQTLWNGNGLTYWHFLSINVWLLYYNQYAVQGKFK